LVAVLPLISFFGHWISDVSGRCFTARRWYRMLYSSQWANAFSFDSRWNIPLEFGISTRLWTAVN
jgi:hypothetical protein